MLALMIRFDAPSKATMLLEAKVNREQKELAEQLQKTERKMFLRLIDLQDELLDEAKLNSFISGFKLAQGIQSELGSPYSFADESERQACSKSASQNNEKAVEKDE